MTPARWDLDTFLAQPRVSGLVLAPDGSRLVASVARPAPDGRTFATALWALDPAGLDQPRRLTRSAPGESGAAFGPDGSLLFTSARPDPERKRTNGARPGRDDDPPAGLWLLPPGGGEARLVVSEPAGVNGIAVARHSGAVVVAADRFAGSAGTDEDEARDRARREAGVSAVLFEQYPARYWDRALGPRQRRLLVGPAPGPDGTLGDLVDLTPEPGRHLDVTGFDVTPDGGTVVTGWRPSERAGWHVVDLVAIDTATGDRRTLLATGAAHGSVRCAPDGRHVLCRREWPGGADHPSDVTLWLVDLATGQDRELTPGLDLWPGDAAWAPDSSAVYFVAAEQGRAPLFRVEVAGGRVTRLSRDGAFSCPCPAPDGETLFALRATVGTPPGAVALDARAADRDPRPVPSPGDGVVVPGRVEELTAPAGDGAAVHAWLVLPESATAADPAPVVVFMHGGPLASWNCWQWRWNAQLLAARGYAVLLPDPALSTGYGRDFVARGWGRWGDRPPADVLAALDAALARPDLDAGRTAAMGGSFGGYLANWLAGHTDRFRAIVTHAGLWSLDQFLGTSDVGVWWQTELGDPDVAASRHEQHSPHRHAAAITTPMLVIHGGRDDRVPVGEALRLWTDLRRHGVDSRFLFFPDENHWIEKPGNIRVWYETVLAFLDHHVRGQDWARPSLL